MEETLTNKTKKGVVWQTLSLVSNSGFTFIVGIILARILLPSDYSIIAMITVFTSVLQIFTDGGLSSALLRKENRTEKDISTVFYYNFTACYVIYFIIFICAPYIADFYEMTDICKIARVFSITLLITPFYSIQLILLKSKIDFKTKCKIEVLCNIFYALTAIIMVYTGWGIWSLIIPSLLSQLVSAILYNMAYRWYPTEGFSMKSFKELFGYSSKLLVARVVNKMYANIAPMVIGKFFSPTLLGLYERAKSWPALPSQTLAISFQSVTFPVLSKIQNDKERLRYNYIRLLKMTSFLIFPLMIGLAAVARPLVIVVLTEKWIDSVNLMQLICLSYMWFPILLINSNLLTVSGRSDLYLHCECCKIIIGVISLCCFLPYGVKTYCLAEVFVMWIYICISCLYAKKIINTRIWVQLISIFPILVNCIVMGFISILAQTLTSINILKLLLGIASGFIYYLLSAKFFFKEQYKETLNFITARK